MPLSFFLGALFGKAAVAAVAKGITGKAAAPGAKGAFSHHARGKLGQHVAGKVAEKVADEGARAVFAKRREQDQKQS
jgi:hypothetical protein